MIPIRDTVRSGTFPVINILLIAINVAAFLWELAQGPRLQESLFLYGIVPARYTDPILSGRFSGAEQWLPFLTSMFLHGGVLHILGNMWFLYIFGDNVEDRVGHFRYLLFYLLCGLLAGLAHLLTNIDSKVPTIGASGAISGVMGAYFLLYPRARILTLIPIIFFFQFIELPAFVFLGYWLLMQLFSASLARGDVGGVAWWAHIGGFIAGMILMKLVSAIPKTGLGQSLRQHTQRRSTPRLQRVPYQTLGDELDLYGEITITPREARYGTRKLVSIPHGMRSRTVMVTIPPSIEEETRLRLRGLGRKGPDGEAGDFFLEVHVGG